MISELGLRRVFLLCVPELHFVSLLCDSYVTDPLLTSPHVNQGSHMRGMLKFVPHRLIIISKTSMPLHSLPIDFESIMTDGQIRSVKTHSKHSAFFLVKKDFITKKNKGIQEKHG